jgi:hypothetical protein
MNIDLSKVYDKVSWTFLQLILLHINFSYTSTKCIMSCVNSIQFVVLIIGASANFFSSTRGLRQGFPLSAYLFLVIYDGLSRLIKEAIVQNDFQGLLVGKTKDLSHLLFVNDILLFHYGTEAN